MKLNDMSKEDLELYSYVDLTKMILEEENKTLNTPTIFRKICDLLELSDDEYTDKIGDYYTSLTTDKDFVLLEDGNWDLRDRQPVSAILSEDDEVYEEDDLEDIEEAEEDMEDLVDDPDEDIDDDVDLDDLDDEDDDDLTIIDEEELED
ncbi:MAG: DNA-directed RNA polymerase subunit delta [Bacilli bacterium]|nr:DNA-directed RNA polymerase subunit delta [Bacilli bacterium]